MKFSKLVNSNRSLNEENMDVIDIVDRLYSKSFLETYIIDWVTANYPGADGFDEIPTGDLEDLLDDIRKNVPNFIKQGHNFPEWAIKLLGVYTKDTIESIYKYKLKERASEYNRGWCECYKMIKDNKLLKK